jgi:16S rRNA U516 pseudouridylate synthase RsuA-like enzyme
MQVGQAKRMPYFVNNEVLELIRSEIGLSVV